MKEGRNENLLNVLEISKKSKKKALKSTAVLIVFTIILMIVTTIINGGWNVWILILIASLFAVMIMFCYQMLTKAYNNAEVEKISALVVERCLSTEYFTQVIPIKQDEHERFIIGLQNRAKFYAIISKNNNKWVSVYVKFVDEEKGRFLEDVNKIYFLEYYSIQEENE